MKSPEPERFNQPSTRLLWGGSAGALPSIPSPGVLFSTEEGGVCVGGGLALCAEAAVVQNSSKKSRDDIATLAELLENLLSTIISIPHQAFRVRCPSGLKLTRGVFGQVRQNRKENANACRNSKRSALIICNLIVANKA
ncbi:hypothetical protein [Candidatus Manganitrophus noduliformans]|uniref:Uncharacterized protein n=1 Tax=Candidatus Manganitrophus noduliformans TaxID=2606439 RepID=A0A7X6DPE7_9BACT|nr:hypothetical protein [Candidatus Manganitrophus noduliformans]NKE70932.1 hypothetical protein [Candidatus Manganitrophus noduliformans]